MSTAKKPSKKSTEVKDKEESNGVSLNSAAELKNFLITIQDRMAADASPIYVVSAMNYVLNLPQIYDCLDTDNREMLRTIWLRLKSSGLTLRQPPLLFEDDAVA